MNAFDWEPYAIMLLWLSPIVFPTLFCMWRYPIKPQYKKGKEEKDAEVQEEDNFIDEL